MLHDRTEHSQSLFVKLSHFSDRFLERFNCKIMAAANSYFRFAVAILFVYIGSRNF